MYSSWVFQTNLLLYTCSSLPLVHISHPPPIIFQFFPFFTSSLFYPAISVLPSHSLVLTFYSPGHSDCSMLSLKGKYYIAFLCTIVLQTILISSHFCLYVYKNEFQKITHPDSWNNFLLFFPVNILMGFFSCPLNTHNERRLWILFLCALLWILEEKFLWY